MVENKNIVDVDFEEKQYYTLEDVVNMTGLSEAKISFYSEKLKNFLNIQSIGMYQIFSSTDIDNLNKIKKLEDDEGLTIRQIEGRLKNGNQEILLKKEDDKINVSFLNFFAKILESQDKKIEQIVSVNQQLVDALNKNNQSNLKLLNNSNEIQQDIKNTITKTIDEKMNSMDCELKSKIDEFTNSVKEELKSSYVKKEEIESLKRKRTLFSWLKEKGN